MDYILYLKSVLKKYYHIIRLKKHRVIIKRRAIVLGNSEFEGDNYIGENSEFIHSRMGKMSYISSDCHIYYTSIGRYSSIAPGCKIIFGDHPIRKWVSTHPAFYKKERLAGRCYSKENLFDEFRYVDEKKEVMVEIGNDVWIATDVKILAGVKIGDGAVICAGAIITKDVPPYSIVGGIPAKVVRYRFSFEDIDWLMKYKWWEKNEEWIKEHAVFFYDLNALKSESINFLIDN